MGARRRPPPRFTTTGMLGGPPIADGVHLVFGGSSVGCSRSRSLLDRGYSAAKSCRFLGVPPPGFVTQLTQVGLRPILASICLFAVLIWWFAVSLGWEESGSAGWIPAIAGYPRTTVPLPADWVNFPNSQSILWCFREYILIWGCLCDNCNYVRLNCKV